MSEWKPIETHDKKIRTPIDLYSASFGRVVNGCWDFVNDAYAGVDAASGKLVWLVPTHWMPVPQPPAGGATAVRAHTTASDPDGDAIVHDFNVKHGPGDDFSIESIISQSTEG